jgi:hypothetical protein
MQARYPLLTLAFFLTACGSQELGPTETSGWEDDGDSNAAGDGDSGDASDSGSSEEDTGFDPICLPGDMRCADDGNIEVCAETGLEWVIEECGNYTECKLCIGTDDPLCEGVGARCAGPCDPDQKPASSEGCSFVATRLFFVRPGHAGIHSLFVGNNDAEGRDATVDFIRIDEGTRDEIIEETIVLSPGEAHQFYLTHSPIMSGSSLLRTGGIYRIKSDLPVTAMQMAPHPPANRHSDTSLLLPEEAERTDFVVPGAPGKGSLASPDDFSGYATIIALEDDTEVTYVSPHVATFGNGAPIPGAAAGEPVTVTLHRYDNMRISAEQVPDVSRWHNWDISGLIINSTKPISVFSGSNCGVYPENARSCDHMQEQVFPLTYWGQEYVLPSVPDRAFEDLDTIPMVVSEARNHWRIFAGADDVTITVSPPVPELPLSMDGLSSVITLENRGDFELFTSAIGENHVVTGDRPFLPVQYQQSWKGGGETYGGPQDWEFALGGDPSMCQMVPSEQWLNDYTFVLTGDYDREYLHIIRRSGGADVTYTGPDGVPVTIDAAEFSAIGEFEVALVNIDVTEEGDFRIESEDDFGFLQGGDNISDLPDPPGGGEASTSYCHPGGIRIVDIFAP